MVCGIVGVLFCYPAGFPVGPIIGVYGIASGVRVLYRIKHDPHRFSGHRLMAVIGIVTGVLGWVIYPLFVYNYTRQMNQYVCRSRAEGIVEAVLNHAERNEGQLPSTLKEVTLRWNNKPASEITCAWNPDEHFFYIPNLSLDMPPETPIVFEAISNHKHGGHIGFLNGEARFCTRSEYETILREHLASNSRENRN